LWLRGTRAWTLIRSCTSDKPLGRCCATWIIISPLELLLGLSTARLCLHEHPLLLLLLHELLLLRIITDPLRPDLHGPERLLTGLLEMMHRFALAIGVRTHRIHRGLMYLLLLSSDNRLNLLNCLNCSRRRLITT